MSKNNCVDHPSHYKKEDRLECIDEMVKKFGYYHTCIFCLMSSYKYLYRAGDKDGNSEDQDLAKACWYVDWVKTNFKYQQAEAKLKNLEAEFLILYNEVISLIDERKR